MDYNDYLQASHKAAHLVEAGDYPGAISVLQALVASDISDFDKAMMCVNLAIVYEKMGQEQTAVDWYDKGIAYEESSHRYTVAEMKAAYLAEKGRNQESLNLYTHLLSQPVLTEADKARLQKNIETLRQRQGNSFSHAETEQSRLRSRRAQKRKSPWFLLLAVLFMIAGMALMVVGAPSLRLVTAEPPADASPRQLAGTSAPLPSPTPEPLVPTRTLEAMAFATSVPTATPILAVNASTSTATPAPTEMLVPTATEATSSSLDFVVPSHERFRLGISLPGGAAVSYNLGALQVGWVMDWAARSSTALPPDVVYMPTVRMSGGTLRPAAATLTAVAQARPGSTWLISNEPDVRWQDNVDPQTYARLYHEAYTAIKAGDPSAVVAAGGIAQPTPLRLRYLDLVLDAYRAEFGVALPAQVWHTHNYMLREERGSWGVDIPPGIPDDTGVLFSVDDSGNLDVFRAQIYDFRRWMASRGYGGQPLIVSEFGVPMPEDYGFPPERMAEFLRETWRFFLTATDAGLGDPRDAGRLVQRWCWFSLYYEVYPTGNLIDARGQWTPLGQAWISYVSD